MKSISRFHAAHRSIIVFSHQGYDNSESSVRKACVFCLVAIYAVIGEDLKPHLSQLASSKVTVPSGSAAVSQHAAGANTHPLLCLSAAEALESVHQARPVGLQRQRTVGGPIRETAPSYRATTVLQPRVCS